MLQSKYREIYRSKAYSSSSASWWENPSTSVARTTRLARMAGMERMSTDFLSGQVILQMSLPVYFFQKKKKRQTGSEDRTPHRRHHRRTSFSCPRHSINAHALAHDELSIGVCVFSKVILSSHVALQLARCPWSSSSLRNQAQPATIH